MTIQEFSDQFDILWNNISSNQAPGLNEYEKSVFLTKAEKEKMKEYLNIRTDGVGGGFDGSQERQYDFSNLIRTETLFEVNTFKERITDTEKLDRRSKVYLFPDNYFWATNELLADDKRQYSVIPLSYAEYQRLMFKSYSYPVKRGAWRLITDKKNCNYYREYVKTTNEDGEEIDSNVDYSFTSGWADQKRNLQINIRAIAWSDAEAKVGSNDYSSYVFNYSESGEQAYIGVKNANTGWSDDKMTYEIQLYVSSEDTDYMDDESIIDILKEGFASYKKEGIVDNKLVKAMEHTDGFAMCSAPSKFTRFQTTTPVSEQSAISVVTGYTFTTKVIQLPMVEIVGKFSTNLRYQMRYVRTLKPIILVNLAEEYGEGVSIDCITQPTECELPVETHQEILERAVTLAKIAWQGGTATQAEAASRSKDKD